MLKIRLQRVGRKHDPSYRVVVTEHTSGPKKGDPVDTIGSYDARVDRKDIDIEKAKHWLEIGAQPSGTVHNIFVDLGLVKGKKLNVLPKRKPVEEKPEEAPAAEPKESGEGETNDSQAEESGGSENEAQAETPSEPEPEAQANTEAPAEEPASEEKEEEKAE